MAKSKTMTVAELRTKLDEYLLLLNTSEDDPVWADGTMVFGTKFYSSPKYAGFFDVITVDKETD